MMPEYLPAMAAVLAFALLILGLRWFIYGYCNRNANQVYTEDNTMDHKDLEMMIRSGRHDVRITVTQACELLAEFDRIKSHLNDALDRKTQLHTELERVKKVANDQAQLLESQK